MNTYEKYQKEYLKKYFHTEEGRKHLKDAQKKYNESDKAKEYNRMKALRWYHSQKEYKNEIKRLNFIEIY